MATILVTGPNGFVGSHLVPALLAAGHRVVGLVRSDAAGKRVLGRLPVADRTRVELRRGDITRRESMAGAFGGVDVVVHLAAIPRDYDGGASLRLVNTEGTRNVVHAAKAAGVRRFVHESALGVEDVPGLEYASSKGRGRRIVEESGLDWTIVEPSVLWGERDGFFNIIAGLVRIAPGLVPVPGRGDAQFQPLAVADLARVYTRIIDDPATIGRTYRLGGPRRWTYREITAEVIRAMGKRRLIVPMPVPLIALVARAAELVRLPFPVASDQLRQLRLDNVTELDSVERDFGFSPEAMEGRLTYLRRRVRDQEPASEAT